MTRPETPFVAWSRSPSRQPERVPRDVRDEYVSIDATRDIYGVVIFGDPVADPDGLGIDGPATASLRARLEQEGDR